MDTVRTLGIVVLCAIGVVLGVGMLISFVAVGPYVLWKRFLRCAAVFVKNGLGGVPELGSKEEFDGVWSRKENLDKWDDLQELGRECDGHLQSILIKINARTEHLNKNSDPPMHGNDRIPAVHSLDDVAAISSRVGYFVDQGIDLTMLQAAKDAKKMYEAAVNQMEFDSNMRQIRKAEQGMCLAPSCAAISLSFDEISLAAAVWLFSFCVLASDFVCSGIHKQRLAYDFIQMRIDDATEARIVLHGLDTSTPLGLVVPNFPSGPQQPVALV